MPVYKMARAFEGIRVLPTEDLLAAVKETINCEADLYINGELVLSLMGFEWEQNIQNLSQYGLVHFIANNSHCFKYADESKNIKRYYVDFIEHSFWKPNCLDVRIHDYRSDPGQIEFESLDSIFNKIKSDYLPRIAIEDIAISEWNNEGCHSHKLPNDESQTQYI